ncbi:MAG: hypothetical protein QM779_00510 [Propionicimonas sp.]|uniref:hypothetical protein n=1 Tax=Propionicimonas sp. TaxID=1955623 RepID=UPI003D0BC063
MLRGTRRLAVITVAGVCLFTGCQVTATPTPTPAPSYRCTPEAGGDEFDCTEKQYQDMVAKDELYAEAEAVYRKFFAEDERILRAGGISTATPVLEETTTGAFLEDSMDYYRSLKKDDSKLVGGQVLLTSLLRVPGASKGGSLVALRACIDASTAEIQIRGKKAGQGRTGSDLLYFGRVSGQLKIQGADGKEGDTCK